jgi:hypothetical protein
MRSGRKRGAFRHDLSGVLANVDGDEGHGVVANDIYDDDGDGVAAGFFIAVLAGGEFDVLVLASVEALPFICEDVAAGRAFLELQHGEFALRRFEAGCGAMPPRPVPAGTLMISRRWK